MIPVANRLQDVTEYYFSIKLKEVRDLIGQGKPIINLGIGSPDLLPPDEVVEAMRNADVHSYQSYQGIPELRKAMASFSVKRKSSRCNSLNWPRPRRRAIGRGGSVRVAITR